MELNRKEIEEDMLTYGLRLCICDIDGGHFLQFRLILALTQSLQAIVNCKHKPN